MKLWLPQGNLRNIILCMKCGDLQIYWLGGFGVHRKTYKKASNSDYKYVFRWVAVAGPFGISRYRSDAESREWLRERDEALGTLNSYGR